METQVLSALRRKARKTCLFCKGPELRRTVAVHISLADQVPQGKLHPVYEPEKRTRYCHVPQDQSPSRTEDTDTALKEFLRMRLMVKPHGTDDRVKAFVREGKIFAVSFHKLCILQFPGPGCPDHLR